MDKALQDMLYLDYCALHNEEPIIDESFDLSQIYTIANKQSLLGLTAYACRHIPRFEKAFLQSFIRVTRIQEERQKICKTLSDNGIWHCALKGSEIYKDYPVVGMREMCDIDILYDKKYQNSIVNIMKKLGYESYGNVLGTDMDFFKAPYYFVEMHHSLFGIVHKKKYQDYYDNIDSRLLGEGLAKRMTVNDLYIYIIVHACKHYEMSGIGIRILVDIYVYTKSHLLDWQYIEREERKLGVYEFEKRCRSIAYKLFDTRMPLSKNESKMLSFMYRSDTYGNNMLKSRGLIDNEGIFYFIAHKVLLLPRDCVRTKYEFFYKKPYLIPFLWIYRILCFPLIYKKHND